MWHSTNNMPQFVRHLSEAISADMLRSPKKILRFSGMARRKRFAKAKQWHHPTLVTANAWRGVSFPCLPRLRKRPTLPGAERAFNGPVEVAPRRPRQENARIAASFHLGRRDLAGVDNARQTGQQSLQISSWRRDALRGASSWPEPGLFVRTERRPDVAAAPG